MLGRTYPSQSLEICIHAQMRLIIFRAGSQTRDINIEIFSSIVSFFLVAIELLTSRTFHSM